ncbi:hypothetical protein SAMN05216360_101545 [Methylobacterium phyllostachyos]|uniref:Uncharacterized protein n=2 Tax=Methylobacterium phyllostachyos TaxID=582672 RepID=A0A1G9S9C5_9HYPH|nr:hypothetical protein SAMN05216360_101545 [Methylobacterium phyllostachyos]
MTRRNSKHREREITAEQVQDLIDMAQKNSASMLAADEINQAYMLVAIFNAADRVYGLWPDSSKPSGYAYSIMKGEPGSAAMRRVAGNPDMLVAGVFQQDENHVDLTRQLYKMLDGCGVNDEAYRLAWSMWLGTVPANIEATKARVRADIFG